ncbi:MAG: hypothetical protein JST04_04350 [Bdellovibrionales bacterium]|nr:hypothetical protein [Bdellovibrionales bacterium]
MKKGTKKGQIERRKHPRRTKKSVAKVGTPTVSAEHCVECGKGLKGEDRALFVEEDVGRIFCSEDCITQHFQADIDLIEKEYFKYRPKDDLSPDEREQFAHLRWITIQEPDEIWQEKRSSGDYRYTLISQFKPGAKSVWCVCICLFLRGEPSFLYMAFPTRSKALVERFRKGKQVEREEIGTEPAPEQDGAEATDGLASGWSQSETLRAEIHRTRDASDIPAEEFGLYENLLEKTLEAPDELWVLESEDDGEPDRYHFIKYFPDEESGPVHYIVVAQESEQSESLEVVEQIPTRNAATAQQFRKGRQELVVDDEDDGGNRTIH